MKLCRYKEGGGEGRGEEKIGGLGVAKGIGRGRSRGRRGEVCVRGMEVEGGEGRPPCMKQWRWEEDIFSCCSF
jgi:hypothetical protein